MSEENEEWRPIKDQPGYYVSNLGRVKSTKRTEEVILSPGVTSKNHLGVGLSQNGVQTRHRVHRLVAEAFIDNPNNLPVVRHLNDDPYDNRVVNLKWGTQKDNVYDSIRSGTHVFKRREMDEEIMRLAHEAHKTPVKATNIVTGEVRFYDSQKEASNDLGIDRASINHMVKKSRQINERKEWALEYTEVN